MSVWDNPDLRPSGEFVKFDNIGDEISGVITAIRPHRFDDGSVAPQVLLTTDDGEERTVTAGQIRLKTELATQRPEAGDHIHIKLTQEEKRSGGKTLKHFAVVINQGRGAGAGPGVPQPAQQSQQPSHGGVPGFPSTYTQHPQQPPVQQQQPVPQAPAQQAPQQGAPDPAAVAAAMANLTPEQRAALGLPPF